MQQHTSIFAWWITNQHNASESWASLRLFVQAVPKQDPIPISWAPLWDYAAADATANLCQLRISAISAFGLEQGDAGPGTCQEQLSQSGGWMTGAAMAQWHRRTAANAAADLWGCQQTDLHSSGYKQRVADLGRECSMFYRTFRNMSSYAIRGLIRSERSAIKT